MWHSMDELKLLMANGIRNGDPQHATMYDFKRAIYINIHVLVLVLINT